MALVVIGGLLLGVDRLARVLVQHQAARQIAAATGTTRAPTVDITGFPFLTQLARGRFDEVRLGLPDPRSGTGAVRVRRVDAVLTGVRVPPTQLLHADVTSAMADHVHVVATVDYSALDQVVADLGPGAVDVRYSSAGPHRVRVTGSVSTPVGTVSLGAVARVTIVAGRLRVVPVPGALARVPTVIRSKVTDLLTVSIAIPPLPYGLTPSGLVVAGDGLRLTADGSAVALIRP